MSQDERAPTPDTLTLLAEGPLEIQGRMPWSSNGTFLATVGEEGGTVVAAIYKPGRTERPLWDFPGGLYRREVAAYELACQLGWGLVPETVLRTHGPLGEGSVQRFVDADFTEHYFTLLEDRRHRPALARMAAFDLVANNADRKGGHCLLDADGHLWGIDHGLCFHTSPKVRTVMWDFAGEPLAADVVSDLCRLAEDGPNAALRALLRDAEVDALASRVDALVRRPVYPHPRTDHPYPWPLV